MRGRKTKMPFFLKNIRKRIFGNSEKTRKTTVRSNMFSASSIIEVRCFARNGMKSVYLCEAEKILKYSTCEIVLRLHRESISFLGEGLLLSGFRSGTVEITGGIREIVFGGREKK